MSVLHDSVAGLCGRSLTTVRTLEHAHDDIRSLVAVWLEWLGGGLQLRTAPDGWGLVAETDPLEPAELGKYGRLEITNLGTKSWGSGRVIGVWTVTCSESPRPVGVRLEIEGSDPLIVYGYDDDLLVGSEVAGDLADVDYERVCAES